MLFHVYKTPSFQTAQRAEFGIRNSEKQKIHNIAHSLHLLYLSICMGGGTYFVENIISFHFLFWCLLRINEKFIRNDLGYLKLLIRSYSGKLPIKSWYRDPETDELCQGHTLNLFLWRKTSCNCEDNFDKQFEHNKRWDKNVQSYYLKIVLLL